MDWSKIVYHRDQIHMRYRKIWNIPLIKNQCNLVAKKLRSGMHILDVGASDRKIEQKLKNVYPSILYKSMDINLHLPHDYHSLDEINEQFDLIILFEVIEHLEFEEGVKTLSRLNELLVDGGTLIISTPNVFDPDRFWLDVTHKTAYSYEELGGIVLSQGFEVLEIYRTFHASLSKSFFRLVFLYPLHRILNVDFAKSIVILAQKKANYKSSFAYSGLACSG